MDLKSTTKINMHLLKVFYYYYYFFYRKIIRDPEPHFATVLALSFSEALAINGIMDIIAIKYYCYQIKVWIFVLIVGLIIFLNYLIFHRTDRANQVIKSNPNILNSKVLSIIITILFFLITVSWLFWGPIYGKYLLEQCR